MKNKFIFLGSLFLAAVACCQLSCTTERFVQHNPASMRQRIDSAARANGIVAKKITFSGPVSFTAQMGQGLTATNSATDNRKAGQKGGAAATAPDAVATATTKKAGVPWWVFVGVAIIGAVAWGWVQSKISFLSFFKR